MDPEQKRASRSLMRFREGTPNNSLHPFLFLLLFFFFSPLQCRVFPVALLLLRTTYLAGRAGFLLLRLRPFDVSDPVVARGRRRPSPLRTSGSRTDG